MYGPFLLFSLLLFLYFTFVTSSSNSEELKILVISDYVTLESKPTSIVAFLCWKRQYLRQLVKELSKNQYITGIMMANMDLNKVNRHNLPHHILYMTDLSCNKGEEILLKANKVPLFEMPYRWLIFGHEIIQQSVSVLQKLNIYPSSEVLLTQLLGNSSFNLFQPYKISANKDGVIMEKYGLWTLEDRITDYRTSAVLSRRRSNLQKSIFRAQHAYVEDDSINHLGDYKDTHIDAVSKIGYVMVRVLLQSLNVTVQEQYSRDWGYPKPDGTYSGLIGDMVANRTDVGSPMIYTKARLEAVRMVCPTAKTGGSFVFRQPPLAYVNNLFALPFSIKTWIITITIIGIIDVFLYFAVSWEWKCEKLDDFSDIGDRLEPKPSDIVMISVGSLSQQGSPVEPKFGSARLAFVVFVIFVMFIYTSFSAVIVVLLQSSSTAINTLKDLTESPLKLGSEETPYYHFFLEKAEDPIKKELYKKKKPIFSNISLGVEKMRREQFAFLTQPKSAWHIVQETFMEHEKCGLQEIDFVGISDVWSGIARNSTYLEIVKVGYFKLQERGIQYRENQHIYTSKPQCTGQGNYFTSVGLTESYFAFYIILAGFGISFGIFLLEIIISKRKFKKKVR